MAACWDDLGAAANYRRAMARQVWNEARKLRQQLRRAQVAHLLLELGWHRGVQSAIARRLGVDRSTVSRDVAANLRELREEERQQQQQLEAQDRERRRRRRLRRLAPTANPQGNDS